MSYTDLQMRAFTQIAYLDLEDKFEMKSKNGEPVALKDLLTDKEKASFIERGIMTESEINTWKISSVYDANYKGKDGNPPSGFYGCVIETSDSPKEAAIGFRGSESLSNVKDAYYDWTEADLKLLNSTLTLQQAETERFLKKNKDLLQKYDSLSLTGHSLGGNLAEHGTIVLADEKRFGLKNKIDRCCSMDGPGFSDEYLRKHSQQIGEMSGKMRHMRWSAVGNLLNDLP